MSKLYLAVFFIVLLLLSCGKRELVAIEATEATEATNAAEETKTTNADNTLDTSDAQKSEAAENEPDNAPDDKSGISDSSLCYIYISGAVNHPGVYEVGASERLFRVIELAGGVTENAAIDYVNLAQSVSDGSQIVIPSMQDIADIMEAGAVSRGDILEGLKNSFGYEPGQTQKIAESAQNAQSNSGKVNINTASAELLQTLSGIGKKRADDIIAYRSEHGDFKTIDDIKNVSGIKGGIFEGIKDLIDVK